MCPTSEASVKSCKIHKTTDEGSRDTCSQKIPGLLQPTKVFFLICRTLKSVFLGSKWRVSFLWAELRSCTSLAGLSSSDDLVRPLSHRLAWEPVVQEAEGFVEIHGDVSMGVWLKHRQVPPETYLVKGKLHSNCGPKALVWAKHTNIHGVWKWMIRVGCTSSEAFWALFCLPGFRWRIGEGTFACSWSWRQKHILVVWYTDTHTQEARNAHFGENDILLSSGILVCSMLKFCQCPLTPTPWATKNLFHEDGLACPRGSKACVATLGWVLGCMSALEVSDFDGSQETSEPVGEYFLVFLSRMSDHSVQSLMVFDK